MVYYPIFFALAATLGAVCVVLYVFPKPSRMRQRLQAPDKREPVLVQAGDLALILPAGLMKKMDEKLGLGKGSPKAQEIKKTLVQAGFSSEKASSVYMGIKIGLALALPILALPFLLKRSSSTIFLMGALYFLVMIGYSMPSLILKRLVARRKTMIREGLPDALDLMVVCVEAGQGLNAAIKRVGDELRFSKPVLAEELLQVNLEVSAGQEREQALRNLGERTGVEEVISLCNILIQSDRFGTGIANTLKIQSDAVRTTRRHKLEEMAAKTPVKLVFPLLLFIFPAIMVVILGPAAIRISETLLK
ncbi:MAG TPA: type II secretion system F family protein [Desulfobaccales bacterium]